MSANCKLNSSLLSIVIVLVGVLLDVASSKRFQYHQQKLNNENDVSYRFGYMASDDQTNPQSRHESSSGPGFVTGSYSFVDANNRLQFVQYESHPENGFRITKQWNEDPPEVNAQ